MLSSIKQKTWLLIVLLVFSNFMMVTTFQQDYFASAASPTVSTNTPTNITDTSAMLHGYLNNDGGLNCSTWFYLDQVITVTPGYTLELTSGWNYNITFPKKLFLHNSSLKSDNTAENFCQQGGIYSNVDGIFRYIDGEYDSSWVPGEPWNPWEYIDNATDEPTYEYAFQMSGADTLSFIYDSTNSGDTFSATLTDLTPGTTYDYMSVAENTDGTSYGSVISFTTCMPRELSDNGTVYVDVTSSNQATSSYNNVTRTISSSDPYTEYNNFSFNPLLDYDGDVTLVVPVSNETMTISSVTNNTSGTTATSVSSYGDLVNNTYWYNSANYLLYIRTTNVTTSTLINWSVRSGEEYLFYLEIPSYLEVGDYFMASGLIMNMTGDAATGIIAKTYLYNSGGSIAFGPVQWNCDNGNYQTTFSTNTLRPGVYDVDIVFEDDSGTEYHKGDTLYLSTDPPSSVHVTSDLYFTFYDGDKGTGLNSESFKIYVSEDTSISSSDRIYRDRYDTYTGETLYYRVDDYFNNQIYPSIGDYKTVNVSSVKQFEDVPIDWNSYSVKNMNHSIVHFKMTNDSTTYSQYLYPYEPFYWNVLDGEYTINLTYYNTATDAVEGYSEENVTITNDGYYWIRGYDLQDIIIEITAVNTSIDDLSIDISTGVELTNSAVNNITIRMNTNLSATETNITNLILSQNSNITLIDTIVSSINTSMRSTLTAVNSTIDTVNNKIDIDLSFLQSNVTTLNNYILSNITAMNTTINTINGNMDMQLSLVNSNVNSVETNIKSTIDLTETNLTTLNNNIWNSVNVTDSIVDYLNNTIWGELTAINLSIDNLNNTMQANFTMLNSSINNVSINVSGEVNIDDSNITNMISNVWGKVNITNSTLKYMNTSIWGEFTITNSNVDDVHVNVNGVWNDQNSSFMNLENRSTVVFNFYNTNEGLGLDRETLKVYVNGSRLTDNFYYTYNETDIINVTIKDYYNTTLFHQDFTISEDYRFLDLGITFHSWLFGNKNEEYYMISILKKNASRWWERGIVPGGEREFMIPSGNYTLRIYDADYDEIYNTSGINVTNSRVYTIEGTNLSEVISGQSFIRGQLLELSDDIDYALMPDEILWSVNPISVCSAFDKYGMMLGNNVWKVCPPKIVIATTRNNTFAGNTTFIPLIPDNDSSGDGAVSVKEDILYLSGNSDYVNITYTDNGTSIQNTTYVPSIVHLPVGEGLNITVNCSNDIFMLRETTYSQNKKFYWDIWNSTNNQGYLSDRGGYHRTSIEVVNSLSTPLYNVRVLAGFSDKTTPDLSTARVTDIHNDVVTEDQSDDFKTSGSGIEFQIDGGIPNNTTRNFLLEYYGEITSNYVYSDVQREILPGYDTKVTLSNDNQFYNFEEIRFHNDENVGFKGDLLIRFSIPMTVDSKSIKVQDMDNDRILSGNEFIPSSDFVQISNDAIGTVSAGGVRTFGIYWQEDTSMISDPGTIHLDSVLFNLMGIFPFTPFIGLCLVMLVPIGAGSFSIGKKRRWDKKSLSLILFGLLMIAFFFMLQSLGY